MTHNPYQVAASDDAHKFKLPFRFVLEENFNAYSTPLLSIYIFLLPLSMRRGAYLGRY